MFWWLSSTMCLDVNKERAPRVHERARVTAVCLIIRTLWACLDWKRFKTKRTNHRNHKQNALRRRPDPPCDPRRRLHKPNKLSRILIDAQPPRYLSPPKPTMPRRPKPLIPATFWSTSTSSRPVARHTPLKFPMIRARHRLRRAADNYMVCLTQPHPFDGFTCVLCFH